MPRNVVNVALVYGIAFSLALSIMWVQIATKKKALRQHLNNLHSSKAYTMYEKCKWILHTGDLSLIMQTLAHVSYKEHTAFLKAYIADKTLSDIHLKTVVLFKTASLYKKKNKRIHFLNMLSEEIKEKQLLLQIAATYCPDIIPALYGWLKTQSKDYVEKQVSTVYNNAIDNNNPLLFDCLLEYDIPLHPKQASEYLKIVLNEKKHHAFVCLLIKAGAQVTYHQSINQVMGTQLIAFQNTKNLFYKHFFPIIKL
ncbi:hypothetical protein EKK58_03495 [Candidatus Dependentiae bacterium]|nr:MAG: hypothetical protein EKK58_03495 [Candidatus Dependentiae bacterium]